MVDSRSEVDDLHRFSPFDFGVHPPQGLPSSALHVTGPSFCLTGSQEGFLTKFPDQPMCLTANTAASAPTASPFPTRSESPCSTLFPRIGRLPATWFQSNLLPSLSHLSGPPQSPFPYAYKKMCTRLIKRKKKKHI